MKKKLFVSIILIIVLAIALFGCAPKSTKVIVEDREISSIDLLVFDDNDQSVKHTLTDEEKAELIEMFDNLGYMERLIVQNKIPSEEFQYLLTINVAKKKTKKAYSYYVYIDKTETYTIGDIEKETRDEKYLRIVTDSKKYEGHVTQEIINYLKQLKDAAIARG